MSNEANEVEDVPAVDPRVAQLAAVEAEIAMATAPDRISWMGNSEALRRMRAEREELRAALAAA
jgi:hypothetical protein